MATLVTVKLLVLAVVLGLHYKLNSIRHNMSFSDTQRSPISVSIELIFLAFFRVVFVWIECSMVLTLFSYKFVLPRPIRITAILMAFAIVKDIGLFFAYGMDRFLPRRTRQEK